MGRIEKRFGELRARGEKALVAYVLGGFPSPSETQRVLREAAASGADLLEVGVPFSDPTADGPVIHEASKRALRQGTTLGGVLGMIRSFREESDLPIVLFSYYNPILAFGLEAFAEATKQAGIDGILVVDLPPEESQELAMFTAPLGVDLIRLLAPTTSEKRLSTIVRRAKGFLYCISATAVTGTTPPQMEEVKRLVSRIRAFTSLPVVVGFGISQPQEARAIASFADGIVVGTKLIEAIERAKSFSEGIANLRGLIRELKRAINDYGTPQQRSPLTVSQGGL